MALPDRETARDRLVALMRATGAWEIVHGHEPESFEGKSPVGAVYNGPYKQERDVFRDGEPDTEVV